MDTAAIQIRSGETLITDCVGAIMVPEAALTEPGYIKTLTVNPGANAKHEFFAMAQMAYYQYQDDELEIVVVHEPIQVRFADTAEEITAGMVICRDSEGELHVLLHGHLHQKKMLETANRYCTRWVRLDI